MNVSVLQESRSTRSIRHTWPCVLCREIVSNDLRHFQDACPGAPGVCDAATVNIKGDIKTVEGQLLKAREIEKGSSVVLRVYTCCRQHVRPPPKKGHCAWYWVHLEIDLSASMSCLDEFIRDLWCDCHQACVHLSQFQVAASAPIAGFPVWHSGLSSDLAALLQPDCQTLLCHYPCDEFVEPGVAYASRFSVGDVFRGKGSKCRYQFDLQPSSMTELEIKCVGWKAAPLLPSSAGVRLLSRSRAPRYACMRCRVARGRGWGIHTPLSVYHVTSRLHLCERCFREREHECDLNVLPVVNSPRTGVCRFTGGLLKEKLLPPPPPLPPDWEAERIDNRPGWRF